MSRKHRESDGLDGLRQEGLRGWIVEGQLVGIKTQGSQKEVRNMELGSKFKEYLNPSIGIVDQHIQTSLLLSINLLK